MVALRPKRVLVPTDFSDESCKAVDEALSMVDDPAQLIVLHVAPEAIASEADMYSEWNPGYKEARTGHLQDLLRKKFVDKKYGKVRFEVLFGSPATEITRYAEDQEIDLIVLPSHGRTGLARLMIGSVAERVVRLAHCPVLVLRE